MGILKPESDFLVYQGDYCPELIGWIKEIPGREYRPRDKAWIVPANSENIGRFKSWGVRIAPEAYEIVRHREEQLASVKQIKETERPEPLEPPPVNKNLFAHQIQCYNIGITLSGAAILHEQGCGKTLTAVAIAGRRYLNRQIKYVLVVAPSSVLPVWKHEFETCAHYPVNVRVLEGTMANRKKMLTELEGPELQVAVINYEAVWRKDIYTALQNWGEGGIDMVIADESQKLKSPSARQSKALHSLSDVRFRLILTGTPITASPLDFWSQYRFLEPSIFGKSFYSFRNRYADYVTIQAGSKSFPKLVGYKNKQELVQKAHSIAHRVTKEDALDLPEWIDQKQYCYLEPKAREAYDGLVRESVALIEDDEKRTGRVVTRNALTCLLRLQQITGGFVPVVGKHEEKVTQISKAKSNLLGEMLEDLLRINGRKVVIFARFVPEIAVIRKMLSELGVDYSWISGAVKSEERGEMVRSFQQEPKKRVFVAQIQTAGLGITLHSASTAIFYSMNFSYADYQQAKARVHRIGQKHKVNYIHLLAEKTIDDKIYGALKAKKAVADDVVDNWREYLKG